MVEHGDPKRKERGELARSALEQKELTRELVELLIEKVIVFPDGRVEVMWKAGEFFRIPILYVIYHNIEPILLLLLRFLQIIAM